MKKLMILFFAILLVAGTQTAIAQGNSQKGKDKKELKEKRKDLKG